MKLMTSYGVIKGEGDKLRFLAHSILHFSEEYVSGTKSKLGNGLALTLCASIREAANIR